MKLKWYCFAVFLFMLLTSLNCNDNYLSDKDEEERLMNALDDEASEFVNVMLEFFYKPSTGKDFIEATIEEFLYSNYRLERMIGDQLKTIFRCISNLIKLELQNNKNSMNMIVMFFEGHIKYNQDYKSIEKILPKTYQAIFDLYDHMRIVTEKFLREETLSPKRFVE